MMDGEMPADKVWAMYDGPNCPAYIDRGKWYEMDDFGPSCRIASMKEVGIFSWGDWTRHVGPTPPDASPASEQKAIVDAFQEAISWHPHDGSAQRPKGVGKRDRVKIQYRIDEARMGANLLKADNVAWEVVTRYRITERAPKKEKRRKVWVVTFGGSLRAYSREEDARTERAVNGGTLFTAKLTPVKDGK